MSDKLPPLKFTINVPLTATFETLPSEAKELPNKYNEEQPKYMYIVNVIGQDGMTEEKHVWFATTRQHEELLGKGIKIGTQYTMLKKQLAGDKYPQFMIAEAYSALQQKVSEVEELFGTEKKTPVNANKQSSDGATMGMCFKIACDLPAHRNLDGLLNLEDVERYTKVLYNSFQKLISE